MADDSRRDLGFGALHSIAVCLETSLESACKVGARACTLVVEEPLAGRTAVGREVSRSEDLAEIERRPIAVVNPFPLAAVGRSILGGLAAVVIVTEKPLPKAMPIDCRATANSRLDAIEVLGGRNLRITGTCD
jgi:hypothetical protein